MNVNLNDFLFSRLYTVVKLMSTVTVAHFYKRMHSRACPWTASSRTNLKNYIFYTGGPVISDSTGSAMSDSTS